MANGRAAELGIGIITYNRLDALKGCVGRVREHTRLPFRLVVADDGSTDGSQEWAWQQDLLVIHGENRGPAWNRNRALYYLMERTGCDPLLLLEDDCWPAEPGWEAAWVEAAARWGHLNFSLDLVVAGSGTPEAPYRSRVSGTQCTVTTRAAMEAVGYLDTRFAGYGYEDAEWTFRFERYLGDRWVPPLHAPPCLSCGLQAMPLGTWHDAASVARQLPLFEQLRQEPIWRPAWRTPEEEAILRQEQRAVALRQRHDEQRHA
jgi:glycosyltransferase involved in cell wall biosynthesis